MGNVIVMSAVTLDGGGTRRSCPLGSGRRLFAEGARATLRLIECVPSGTGVLVATHRPTR